MRYAKLLCLFAVLVTVATASNETLPRSVADDVRSAMDKAGAALEDGDRQLALALYKGSLYPEGIKLALDGSTVTSDDQSRAVYLALGTWETELNGDFPVTLVDEVKDADVVVRFVDSIPDRGTDALGVIKLEKRFKWSQSRHEVTYKGTISVVKTSNGDRLDMAETRDVVMHEIGHLLGLGDTPELGLLMGPMERGHPVNRPTAGEVEDIKTLRRALRERIRQAAAAQN